jgi:hypothetical protein
MSAPPPTGRRWKPSSSLRCKGASCLTNQCRCCAPIPTGGAMVSCIKSMMVAIPRYAANHPRYAPARGSPGHNLRSLARSVGGRSNRRRATSNTERRSVAASVSANRIVRNGTRFTLNISAANRGDASVTLSCAAPGVSARGAEKNARCRFTIPDIHKDAGRDQTIGSHRKNYSTFALSAAVATRIFIKSAGCDLSWHPARSHLSLLPRSPGSRLLRN